MSLCVCLFPICTLGMEERGRMREGGRELEREREREREVERERERERREV